MSTPETQPKPLSSSDVALEFLRAEYQARARRNPRFSLRAFARVLGISPARLSQVLSRKRKLTRGQALRITAGLGCAPAKARWFIALVEEGKRAARTATPATAARAGAKRYHSLADDEFNVVADWQHFAILSLLETDDARDDPSWIARRLGLPVVQVRGALERLERVGLIAGAAGARRPTFADLATTNDMPSAALRRSHAQTLRRAERALNDVPVDERDVSSVTMAIDRARLPEAKALIREFRRSLAALLEAGAKNEVYELNIQLVPITKRTQGRQS